jgi:glycosyltransferase involved in cell wall biosynthesis
VVIGAFGQPFLDEAKSLGYETLRVPAGVRVLAGMRAIARTCRERSIDVISAQSVRMTGLAGMARSLRMLRAGLVTTIHNIADRRNDRMAQRILSRFPDELVFVSRFEQERLAEVWGTAIGEVIYSGVELPAPGSLEPLDLSRLHGISPDARVIGYVGRLSPEKAVGDAIAALPRLPEDVVLCIVGEGPEEGALRADARRKGVERRVVFAGFSREVPRYMASFVGLVLTSRRESLPVVLREAASIGLPVIAADVGGVREIVAPRETGLLFPSGDVDGLVRAIRSLLDDPSRAATMGCAARERVARTFDPKTWVDQTEALLARAAAQGAE